MQKIVFSILLISVAIICKSQINEHGIYITAEYYPNIFNSDKQINDITQDHRGLIYLANSKGIIEYDGNNFRPIFINNGKTGAECVAADNDGTIFSGGYNEIGYLKPDGKGNLIYQSVRNSFLQDETFESITHIYFKDNEVYFSGSKNKILVYNKKTGRSKVIKNENFDSYPLMSNSVLITSSNQLGTGLVINSLFVPLKGTDKLKKNITDFKVLNNNEYLINYDGDLYLYNCTTCKNQPIVFDKISALLKKEDGSWFNTEYVGNGLYSVISNRPTQHIAQMTFDSLFKVKQISNRESGLTLNYAKCSRYIGGYLWILNSGFTKIEINSPFRRFVQGQGLSGIPNDIINFENKIFVATGDGLLYLTQDEFGFTKFKKLESAKSGNVNNIIESVNPKTGKHYLLIACDKGILQMAGNKINVLTSDRQCNYVYQTKMNPDYFYADFNGLYKLEYNADFTKIRQVKHLDKIKDRILSDIVEDNHGNIWCNVNNCGIVKISIKNDSIEYFNFSSDVAFVNNRLIVYNNNFIKEYNYELNKFTTRNIFGESYCKNIKCIKQIYPYGNGYLLITYEQGVSNFYKLELLKRDSDNILKSYTNLFNRLTDRNIKKVYMSKDSVLWLLTDEQEILTYKTDIDKFAKFDNDTKYGMRKFNALIRKVMANDSLIFNGCFMNADSTISLTQNQNEIASINYDMNNISITFSAPFYEREDFIEYSYYLEGYNNNWSTFSKNNQVSFNDLKEGKYTFMVKAKNIYDVESEIARYSFVIKTPWYRTLFALLTYILIVIIAFNMILKLYTKKIKEDKRQLESIVKRRTAELIVQKEEIECQRDELTEQNEILMQGINYAGRIQKAALTPKQTINSIFPENFLIYLPRNVVSGDFYWISQIDNKKICVADDCTGHGVPGAFMSLLCISYFNQLDFRGLHTDDVLYKMRALIIAGLHQTGYSFKNHDGMDLSIFTLDNNNFLEYSGANNPMIIIKNNQIIEFVPDHIPVGIYIINEQPFTRKNIQLNKGDIIYSFTDGFQDQFGEKENRKYLLQNFKNLIFETSKKPFEQQKEILLQALSDWKGKNAQTDDILVFAIKI